MRGRALIVAAAGLSMLVACAAAGAVPASSAAPGPIVFVSSIATPPGAVDALAPGLAPHDLRPPALRASTFYAPYYLAVAPRGRRIAYWGYVGANVRLFIAHDDGSATRTLRIPTAGASYSYDRPVFSSDGSRILLVESSWTDGRARMALLDPVTGRSRPVGGGACFEPVEWSPDGTLLACASGPGSRVVPVFDLAGHRRFRVVARRSDTKTVAFWSTGDLLAVTNDNTEVVDARGSSVARAGGAALGWAQDGRTLILDRPGAVVSYDTTSGATATLLRTAGTSSSDVTLTPDGRAIVVAGDPPRPFRVVPIEAGAPHSFTIASLSAIALSQQGRYAYTRVGKDGFATVVVAGLAGGRGRVVGRFPYDSHGYGELSWLPDGHRVLYSWSARAPRDLWSMRPDGSDQRRLTRAGDDIGDPAWSRDGRHLAFAAAGFEDDLCGYCSPRIVVSGPTAGRGSQQVLDAGSDSQGESAPSWSPTGTQLVVETDYTSDSGLSIVAPARKPVVLTKTGMSPAWSPDGSQIAYVDRYGIGILDLSSHVERTLLPGNAKHPVLSVTWSPDATLIAFTTDRGLYLIAADGSQPPRAIVRRAAQTASFSPDGHELVFQGAPAPNGDTIFTIHADGSALRPIALGEDPAWRPV